ncbi:transglycosylase domain-containing protein [Pararhizobium haloflavum]|uniref:transglycosylase domain-containing protein n=1 Tax=Pararhizobium haloflavum TaxID=2037914 RepID=UPI000C19E982|nr:transglycosylase domain-containing protein [Pararhizobium haloflavum]
MRRIEPTFEGNRPRGEDIRVGRDDRVSASNAGRKRSNRAQNGRGGTRARKKSGKRGGRAGGGGGGLFRLARGLVYWCCVLGIWGAIGVGAIAAYYAAQMPNASTWSIPDRPPNVRIVSVGGAIMANRGATGGEQLALTEMSPFIPQAVMAIEDRRFQSHFGIDPLGLARAMVANLMAGDVVQGGSTVTQQLAKNLFLSPERTVERKVQEVLLALWLEHRFSKDQIMEMYLNRVYFGSNAYGVQAASRRYFNKPAKDVTLAEAALLAGLLKAPSRLSPARDPQAAEERAQVVLHAMADAGYVTDAQVTTAMTQSPTRAPSFWTGAEHYVADAVMDELPDLIGEVTGDIVVETTIDSDLQQLSEAAIQDAIDENGETLNVSQGALVALDATGAIRAMVGGRNYAESQFNRATDARRQPGSAFKPFVYAAALEMGLSPYSVRNDAPIQIGNWSPSNYDNEFRGQVTLHDALASSLNTIAAQLVMEVGPANVVSLAERLGIKSALNANASIALGTSEVTLTELTSAYAPMMNGGYGVSPYIISRVTDDEGKVLFERGEPEADRVLDPAVAGTMNMMLSEVVSAGTGRNAQLEGWQAAGKTGTTQSFRDALFVGYTANLVAGVWFGNDDGTSMNKVTGGGLPARAWQDFMAGAHSGVPVAALPGPPAGRLAPPESVPQDGVGSIIAGDDPSRWGADLLDYPGDQRAGGPPVPPANVGEGGWGDAGPPPVAEAQPRRTTLLDFLMGN